MCFLWLNLHSASVSSTQLRLKRSYSGRPLIRPAHASPVADSLRSISRPGGLPPGALRPALRGDGAFGRRCPAVSPHTLCKIWAPSPVGRYAPSHCPAAADPLAVGRRILRNAQSRIMRIMRSLRTFRFLHPARLNRSHSVKSALLLPLVEGSGFGTARALDTCRTLRRKTSSF